MRERASESRGADISRDDTLCIARLDKPHGLAGAIRLTLFNQNSEILRPGTILFDQAGRRQFRIIACNGSKSDWRIQFDGISTRDDAQTLSGELLYIRRADLPALAEDEWYWADLIGLGVVDLAGTRVGEVVAVHNFGAGDLIELKLDAVDDTVFVPFVAAIFPQILLADRQLIFNPPSDFMAGV